MRSPKGLLSWKHLGICLTVAMLAFALWTVVRRPMLGMADNGDFWRITQSVGLAHAVPAELFKKNVVRREFLYVAPRGEKLLSSAALVAASARVLSGWIEPTFFDLRFLGVVYGVLFVAGVVWAWRSGMPLLLVTLWVWILVDPNYLLFFNSFYPEPLLLLSVVGICALLVGARWERPRPFAGLCLLALLGATTKSPYALLPLTVAVAVFCVYGLRRAGRALLLVGIACIPPVLLFMVPTDAVRYLARINRFNTVFFGVAKASSQPREILARLGIPPAYQDLTGRHFFEMSSATYPEELEKTLQRVSLWKILAIYAAQPRAVAYAGAKVAEAMTVSCLPNLNQLEGVDSSAGPIQYKVPWQFSRPRDRLLRGRLWLVIILLVGCIVWIVARVRRGPPTGMLVAELFLWMTAVSQGVIAVLGDGFFALERHMILARFATDLLVAAILMDVVLLRGYGAKHAVQPSQRRHDARQNLPD